MKYFILFCLSLWIWVTACNDPVLVGSGLLDEDSLDIGFTDALVVSGKTIEGEPSVTFRNFANGYTATTYMIGEMDDAVFGKSKSTTYFTPTLGTITLPEFTRGNLDSVVLSIPLDSVGFYGDINATHNLELKALANRIDLETDSTLFSDLSLETTDVLATSSLRLDYRDSTRIKGYVTTDPDTILTVFPQLRMTLENDFWINLSASEDSLTQEKLLDALPGFELSTTPSSSSTVGLSLSTASNLLFYFTQSDNTRTIYNIPLGRIRHSNFTFDYAGSDLGESLEKDDEPLFYLQSQAGVEIALDISDIRNYQDQILNAATMQLSILSEDETLYNPTQAIFALARNEDGDLEVVGTPSNPDNPIQERFENGMSSLSYSLDLTSHLNQVKKGNYASDTIFLTANSKAERPNRSIIYGTNHPDFPLEVNLILTKP